MTSRYILFVCCAFTAVAYVTSDAQQSLSFPLPTFGEVVDVSAIIPGTYGKFSESPSNANKHRARTAHGSRLDRAPLVPDAPSVPVSKVTLKKDNPKKPSNSFYSSVPGMGQVDNLRFSEVGISPADPGACAGDGILIETMNNAITFLSSTNPAITLKGPLQIGAFFGIPFDMAYSSPSCFYDLRLKRFVVVMVAFGDFFLGEGRNSETRLYFAMNTYQGLVQHWFRGYLITTYTCGVPPCFIDYPILGANEDVFIITTNNYPNNGQNQGSLFGIVQPTIFFIQKSSALALRIVSTYVPLNDAYAYARVMLTAPDSTPWTGVGNGVAFGVVRTSVPTYDVHVFAITGTRSLNFTVRNGIHVTPLEPVVIGYTSPPRVNPRQPYSDVRDGGDCVLLPTSPASSFYAAAPLQAGLQPGGVYYANGRLFVTFSSSEYSPSVLNQPPLGIRYLVIRPNLGRTETSGPPAAGASPFRVVQPTLVTNVQITLPAHDLLYPSIAMSGRGIGMIVFSLVGASYFPSAAFLQVSASGPTNDMVVYYRGGGPLYTSTSQDSALFGDWSTVAIQTIPGSTSITFVAAVMATPNVCLPSLNNWGTALAVIRVGSPEPASSALCLSRQPFCSGVRTLRGVSGSFDDGSTSQCSYRSNTTCGWLIDAGAPSSFVTLTIVKFQTEDCCDTINVYNGQSPSAPLLRRLAGTGAGVQVASTGRYLFVLFRSDGTINRDGFSASWRVAPQATRTPAPKPTCPYQQVFKNTASGTFGFSSAQYSTASTVCSWLIKAPVGSYVLLTVAYYKLWRAGDFDDQVAFFDGVDSSRPARDPTTGLEVLPLIYSSEGLPPAIAASTSSNMLVQLTSYQATALGAANFSASYVIIRVTPTPVPLCRDLTTLTSDRGSFALNIAGVRTSFVCVWRLQAPAAPGWRVRLVFVNYALTGGLSVSFYDGADLSAEGARDINGRPVLALPPFSAGSQLVLFSTQRFLLVQAALPTGASGTDFFRASYTFLAPGSLPRLHEAEMDERTISFQSTEGHESHQSSLV